MLKIHNPGYSSGKSTLLLLLAILLVISMTSCSGGSPKDVVARYSLAVLNKDLDKAKKYCTDSFNSLYMNNTEAALQNMPSGIGADSGDIPTVSEMAEDLEESMDGDTARVWAREADWMVYVLKKEGGRWKIDSMDMGKMMEGLQDMMKSNPEMFKDMPQMPSK